MVAAKSRSFELSTAATFMELHHVSMHTSFLGKEEGGEWGFGDTLNKGDVEMDCLFSLSA